MGSVAEKQVRTSATPRRAALRPNAVWSAKSAEHGAIRAIVSPRAVVAPIAGARRSSDSLGTDHGPTFSSIQRMCADCSAETEELQRAPLAAALQRAIEVGAADDEFEREADAMADQVMRSCGGMDDGSAETRAVQRESLPAKEEEEEKPAVQRLEGDAAFDETTAAQRACADCNEELQRAPLEREDEEHVQRASADEITSATEEVRAPNGADAVSPLGVSAVAHAPSSHAASVPSSIQRACAECNEELQRAPLEQEEEEHVQREMEAPTFDGAAGDDDTVQRATTPRVQMKIAVGPADDEFEREADAMADHVMRAAVPRPSASQSPNVSVRRDMHDEDDGALQRFADAEEMHEPESSVQRYAARATTSDARDDEERPSSGALRRRAIGRAGGQIEDADLTARLRSPSGGRPLPDHVRAYIEPHLQYDFSDVRVHDSAEDRADAAALNARAFTYGRHIWIGPNESADNPRLMAHELTHVVQQGAAKQATVQRGEGDEEQEPGWVARQALGLVRRYAPTLEPILRRGPINWLRDQFASVFDGLVGTINRLNPGRALDELSSLFQGLIARAEPIVTALRSGDCGPLFQAITDLKNFVTEVAGNAWDKLTDFLQPVGDFFTNLWNGYGAPALEWLQNFAGDLWDSLTQLGHDIWDWTQPIRDALGAAWSWVKEQLFGPEDEQTDGDSEGGIVGWITRKATEAWDWVKEQTRPVWEPVADAAAKIRELIPPPFIRNLGQQFQQLSQNINQASEEMNGGDDVAENRQALAAALPTVQQVIASVREVIVSARGWVLEKIDTVSGGLSGLLGRLRGSSFLRPLATLLGWLGDAATSLGSWAHEKVAGLFDWVLQAFDYLSPFVQKLITIVRNVISVVGDLLQLPSLVLNAVWNLIPECIRNPIRDFLVNQILARIPVFSTLLQLPDIWNRVEATALRILRQVFVDGNIARAAWTFFSSMLEVLGIPPQLVVGILAKAAAAIGDILSDPVGFLLNLLSAVKEGFIRFFGNIGTHLLNGVTGWLFGHLTRAGLQPPEDFSLGSILRFVLQVLDITVDRVFERLARRVDPVIVQRLRQALTIATGVWRFVAILIEEGPAGLWREVQEQLSGLWNRVLDAVVGWVTRTVVERVSARLLTMLDPSGVMAVVNSLIALYRAIQSAVEYLREMLMIVDRVLDGINGIAHGAIDIAAGFLETALASGVPVAIGFLANQIGLRDFGERIQEMVEGVRAMVDRAIDWLIDRAIAGGQALLNMLRRGVAAIRNWWAARKPFTSEEGEAHTLYFEGSGSSARLMIQSDPQNYRDFINGVDVPPAKQAAKAEALQIAGELDQAVARANTTPAAGTTSAAGGGGTGSGAGGTGGADPAAEIDQLLERLAAATARFIPRGSGASSEPVYGPLANGFGSSVRVARLTNDHPDGSGPGVDGGHWDALRRRQDGGGSYYVRGHLLNDNLGGPGTTWTNLTPLTQRANNRAADSMLHRFETPVKNAVQAGKRVNFTVTASYTRSHPLAARIPALQASPNPDDQVIASIIRAEQYVPTTLQCDSKEVLVSGEERAAVAQHTVDNSIEDSREEDYQLTPQPKQRVYINEMSATDLQNLDGIDATKAAAIVAGRPFRTGEQVKRAAGLSESQWQAVLRTSGFHVRIYRIT
ncbi:MAG: DUF4157 domain-containing protein [Sulfurifustis sp.]